jgi:hypothetical protein
MRTISSGDLDNLHLGNYITTWLLLLDWPTGLTGFWPGYGSITVGGQIYNGAGSLLTVEQIDLGSELNASPLNVFLRAVPNTALSPDILAQVDDYVYKNRPAYLDLAWFLRSSGAIVNNVRWWQGYIDTIEHDETIGGEYVLVARLEPASLDHSRIGYRMRSDKDQKLFDPNDRFFEHAALTPTEELSYGKSSASPGGSTATTWRGLPLPKT